MPRRSSDGVPGTVYAKGGYLYMRVGGVVKALGLPDTRANRRIAQGMKRDAYLASLLPHTESTQSYAQAWDRFVREHPRLSAVTVRNYRLAFDRVITKPAEHVSANGLIEAVAGMSTKGLTDASVNTYIRQFRVFAQWAAETYGLRPLKLQRFMRRVGESEVLTYTDDELRAIVAHAHERYRPLIRFMALTGARPSDAMRLTRSSVVPMGVKWLNKVTKVPEPRPVCTAAWQIARREVPFPPHERIREYRRSFMRTLERAGIEAQGRGLQELRTSFKRRIDGLPWHWQTWLMRHHTGGVTERHYQSFDWAEVVRVLDELPEI